MSTRVVVCDFCSRPLVDAAVDFAARDLDYGAPRFGPTNVDTPVEGSIGSWLACPPCAELVEQGDRDALAQRSAQRFEQQHGRKWVRFGGGREALLATMRDAHDRFWAARLGPGRAIDARQLALIATDPAFVREWREGRRPG